jgi:hypothetical protein
MTLAQVQVASQFAVLTSTAVATSDILKDRFVQILDRSTFNDEEKRALTDLITELGGSVTFRIVPSRGSDICIVGSAAVNGYSGDLLFTIAFFQLFHAVQSTSQSKSC